MKSLPTDTLATDNDCYIDDKEPKQIKLFAKKYCGVDLIRWQYEDFILPVWGWRRVGNKLRYRKAHLWLPKKSGKSFILAVVACWKATGSTKTKTIIMSGVKEQTDEIWECIEGFIANNDVLAQRLWIRRDKGIIVDRTTTSQIKIISGKGDAKSGFNCDLLIIDEFFELHPAYAQRTWDKVVDVGMARPNSLVITISHANYNHTGPAYAAWQRTQDALAGKSDDWTTYHLHYGVPEFAADWKDESQWWPNLPGCPELVPQSWYREKFNEVKDSPVDSVQFRTFHLNQITSVARNWLSPMQIGACHEKFDESKFYGQSVVIGVDAAKSYDVYCYTICAKIDDLYYVLPKFFIPEKCADKWEKSHHVPYTRWRDDPNCNLEFTPGDCIDHLLVVERLKREAAKYRVLEIRYDPTNFESSRQLLSYQGIPVKQVGPNKPAMAPCFKFLETLITTRQLRHASDPIFLNHLDNCVPSLSDTDQLIISRAQESTKIDAVDATAIGLSYWIDKDIAAQTLPPGQSYAMVF